MDLVRSYSVGLTVVITPTIVRMTAAIAEMMASIPPPIAETIDPCEKRRMSALVRYERHKVIVQTIVKY